MRTDLLDGPDRSGHDEVDAEEDDAELAQLDVGAQDVVLGVSASGRTPYTLGAIAAREAGRGTDDRPGVRARLRAGALPPTWRSRSTSGRR